AREMDTLLSQDQTLRDQAALLRSAPGVGPVIARGLLAELPELGQCDRKALAAITGTAPYPRESGAWLGKRHIRGGRREPRNLLYLAALSATRSSSDLAACYSRLRARGKAPKLALLAIARKLLTRLNAMLRDHKPWIALQNWPLQTRLLTRRRKR
ncbi:transposase, partial [Mycobacteroides abscessus]